MKSFRWQGPRALSAYTSEGIDVNTSECTLRARSHPREGLRAWDARQAYKANSYCADGYAGVSSAKPFGLNECGLQDVFPALNLFRVSLILARV